MIFTGVHPEAPERWRHGMIFTTPVSVDNGEEQRRDAKKRSLGNHDDFAQPLSYSSWRRHQTPVSLRPLGARSSHWYMPQMPSSPRA